jgi:hypothetical protein
MSRTHYDPTESSSALYLTLLQLYYMAPRYSLLYILLDTISSRQFAYGNQSLAAVPPRRRARSALCGRDADACERQGKRVMTSSSPCVRIPHQRTSTHARTLARSHENTNRIYYR